MGEFVDCPLPSSPMKGEVPLSVFGLIVPEPPADTLALMGEIWGGEVHRVRKLRPLRAS
jgi:hypothetical protein